MRSYLAIGLLLIFAVFTTDGIASDALMDVLPAPTHKQTATDKGKRNTRPNSGSVSTEKTAAAEKSQVPGAATYLYEFVRPGFLYGHIWIEHDDKGRGTISFLKEGYDEKITDPLALSTATVSKIEELVAQLDFLGSTEEYQFEKDFSHLGNVIFTHRRNGKERTVKYNWTTNKYAKDLMDEYRRIGNEYTWLFEFGVARENQPLRTPAMMDHLDGFLRRKEISHPPHLLPFLTQVASDEKLPLIARNHASRLIDQIEKSNK